MRKPDFDLEGVPQAYSVKTFVCANPECGRIHVVLEDESRKPIAHFVAPDDFGVKLVREQEVAAEMRDDPHVH
jgi:hypothetical protein